jgi:hypothetical protein
MHPECKFKSNPFVRAGEDTLLLTCSERYVIVIGVIDDLTYLLVSFIQRAGLPTDPCWQTSLCFPISVSLPGFAGLEFMATTHKPSYSSKAASTDPSSAGAGRAYIPCVPWWTIWPIASHSQHSRYAGCPKVPAFIGIPTGTQLLAFPNRFPIGLRRLPLAIPHTKTVSLCC